jgi:hypothetical protein
MIHQILYHPIPSVPPNWEGLCTGTRDATQLARECVEGEEYYPTPQPDMGIIFLFGTKTPSEYHFHKDTQESHVPKRESHQSHQFRVMSRQCTIPCSKIDHCQLNSRPLDVAFSGIDRDRGPA